MVHIWQHIENSVDTKCGKLNIKITVVDTRLKSERLWVIIERVLESNKLIYKHCLVFYDEIGLYDKKITD